MKVVHVITGLNVGGAEIMLRNLLDCMGRSGVTFSVISLTDIGPIGNEIRASGIPVWALSMRPGMPSPWTVLKLAQLLRRESPDVVQTWMYHADLIGGLAAKTAGSIPVVWGIHCTGMTDPQGLKRRTLWTARACAWLSRFLPMQIICCGESPRAVHAAFGYAADKMVVIPNGFDLRHFSPDPAARGAVRQELGIPPDAPLIGLAARFDPQKDHAGFVEAAALLHTHIPDVHFVLCGDGVGWDNLALVTQIDRAGLRSRCHLLGRRNDMPRIYASLDIATSSSSYGEAFPMVIGEAMACGVPCVVTDVGDSARIVGDTGRVVPPRDPVALANAWRDQLQLKSDRRAQQGQAARKRIAAQFSLVAVAAQYQTLYEDVAVPPRNGHQARRERWYVWH